MKRLLACMAAMALLTSPARAEFSVTELQKEDGTRLTSLCYEVEAGDSYISGDNRLYEVVRVEGSVAVARDAGAVTLPDVSWLDSEAAVAVSALGSRRIALYCTHSDESYQPTDGYYSSDERGSIYKVALALADALTEEGVEGVVSDRLHHPHDAGAYRRSRQTAVELLRDAPDALIDVHRDGIPDPADYETRIAGQEASKIRLLVGRGNQNMEVNKEFALMIKAVADRVYPGLIKDIYMGRGVYNQDLLPRSILLECGTYTLPMERVMVSMPLIADVISRAMYGGVRGSAGVSDVGGTPSQRGGIVEGEPDPVSGETKAAGKGIGWIVGIGVVALVGYGVLSSGTLRGGMRKAGRHLSEMTGGLIGKKPGDHEDPGHS